MAMADFLRNITTAAIFLSPAVASDSSDVDAAAIEGVLSRAALWLTPGAVAGFDPNEFAGLSPSDRAALASAVDRFRSLAATVPANGPAPTATLREALPVFLDILRRTAAYTGFGRDPEERRVWEALERVRQGASDFVFDFRVDTDWSGEPAVHIWLVVPDGTDVTSPAFRQREEGIRQAVLEEFHRSGINRWPYVRLKTQEDVRDEYQPAGTVA